MRFPLFALLAALIPVPGIGQFFPDVEYPKGYFRNPLNIPIDLSGNFGELRPNHYHMGLDLKTRAAENQPVSAAADGYIARIKIEPAGFGRAIYINHPNGYTTLYAHLNDFNPALEKWVKEQQYRAESWAIQLELPPGLFPVKKGDFIAYSGNTGGSQAPHLHFEIRRTSDEVNLNPMLFGFPLEDHTKPRLIRLAIYNRQASIYETSPLLLPLKATASGYATASSVITIRSPRISLGLSSFDTHDGSNNQNGVYEVQLFVNGRPESAFRMDQISYNSTRYLNAHIDYRGKSLGGPFIQLLFPLPGYSPSIYSLQAGSGLLEFEEGEVKQLRIVVKDAYGNSSVVNARVQYISQGSAIPSVPSGKMFYPQMLDGWEGPECEFYIGERCLYDSVHVRYASMTSSTPGAVSALHAIGAPYIPLQESYLIRIKPNKSLTTADKARTVMQWFSGSRKDVQKVEWQQDWAAARFRDFGYYQLLVDDQPPEVVMLAPLTAKSARIAFTIRDNLEKFKNVRAELDGKWLRFTNDKGRNFYYRFDEKCAPGTHRLVISAEDEAGNRTVKEINFTR